MNVSTIVTKSKAFTQLSNCYSSVSPVMGCRVTLYLSQGSALSQVNYDPQNSLSGGEKNPQSSSSSSLDTVSSSPRSHERTILGWDNIIPQETRGRNACSDSAEWRQCRAQKGVEWKGVGNRADDTGRETYRSVTVRKVRGWDLRGRKDSIQRSPEEELQHRRWRQGCSRLEVSLTLCWWKTERPLIVNDE